MDKGQPWSVKGIDPETRQAAKMAARRAGLTVGAWLNAVIQRAAAEELGTAAPSQAVPPHGLAPNLAAAAAPGQQMPGQPAPGQAFSGQAFPGQAFPGPAFPGQAYPVAAGYPAYPGAQAVQGAAQHGVQGGTQDAAMALETLLEALRRQTEEVKAAIRTSADELRYNTDKISPMAERLRPMGDRLDAIAARLEQSGELDARLSEAERKAERAALQVTPLERTLTRLFERMDGEDQMSYPDPDGRYRRRGLFGKLFGD